MRASGMSLALLTLCTHCALLTAQERPAHADAPLRAMAMIDAREGWAVGDDGLILHTLDGWETCERQNSHVRASLRGICFLDGYLGYAVGAEVLPFGRGSVGIILATQDGGVTWQKLINKELPGLHAVHFVDAVTGYAFGDINGGHFGGVFLTENGGRSWRSLNALAEQNSWRCATLLGGQPVFAGPMGRAGALEKDDVTNLPLQARTTSWKAMAVQGQDAWLVGTGAAVMVSRGSGGKSWQDVSLPLSDSLRTSIDFSGISCRGRHIWIAGRPGSVVYHSWDEGKSWEAQRTGQPLPLHGICFVNEQIGWAFGEFGVILASSDAGKTWTVRRRGGLRAGLMLVAAAPEQFSLGAVARFGGDEGYLVTAVQAAHCPGKKDSETDRLAQAMRLAGGASGEVLTGFPLPDYQRGLRATTIQNRNKLWPVAWQDENGPLLESLVLALRMWRPSVLVMPEPPSRPNEGVTAEEYVNVLLRRACELSGKADAFPDQIAKLDLQPWQPMRLFAMTPAVNTAIPDEWRELPTTRISLEKPLPALFASPADFANLARPLLMERFTPLPPQAEFTLVKSWCEPADVHDDLMAGLPLGHGGQARRNQVENEEARYQLLLQATAAQAAQAQEHRAKMKDPVGRRQFFVHFQRSLAGLAPITIGDRIFAQAQQFADSGEWLMARECHLMLLDVLPTHRLSSESCRFLMTTMGSSEIKRRADLRQMQVFHEYPLRAARAKGETNAEELDLTALLMARRTPLQRRRSDLRQWHRGTLAAGEILAALDPLAYYETDLQFCLQASQRMDGDVPTSRLLQTVNQTRLPAGPRHDAATAETWLMQRTGSPPRPLMQASKFPRMPKLDGILDDPCWKSASIKRMAPAEGQASQPTEVMLGYDDQFLYLGVRCAWSEAADRPALVKPRKRDDDLRQYDRVSFMIDLDRDYCTFFHFEFDQRGCVAEDCCGDRTWNPKWFLEVHHDERGWTAEAAIPLAELTGDAQLAGRAWAANLMRITPGVGVQAVSLPAEVRPNPAGMGLLLFDGDELIPAGK